MLPLASTDTSWSKATVGLVDIGRAVLPVSGLVTYWEITFGMNGIGLLPAFWKPELGPVRGCQVWPPSLEKEPWMTDRPAPRSVVYTATICWGLAGSMATDGVLWRPPAPMEPSGGSMEMTDCWVTSGGGSTDRSVRSSRSSTWGRRVLPGRLGRAAGVRRLPRRVRPPSHRSRSRRRTKKLMRLGPLL